MNKDEKGKEKIKEEREKEKENEQEEKAPLRLSAGGPPPSFFNHSELFEAYNELQRLAREYVHTSFSVY